MTMNVTILEITFLTVETIKIVLIARNYAERMNAALDLTFVCLKTVLNVYCELAKAQCQIQLGQNQQRAMDMLCKGTTGSTVHAFINRISMEKMFKCLI